MRSYSDQSSIAIAAETVSLSEEGLSKLLTDIHALLVIICAYQIPKIRHTDNGSEMEVVTWFFYLYLPKCYLYKDSYSFEEYIATMMMDLKALVSSLDSLVAMKKEFKEMETLLNKYGYFPANAPELNKPLKDAIAEQNKRCLELTSLFNMLETKITDYVVNLVELKTNVSFSASLIINLFREEVNLPLNYDIKLGFIEKVPTLFSLCKSRTNHLQIPVAAAHEEFAKNIKNNLSSKRNRCFGN